MVLTATLLAWAVRRVTVEGTSMEPALEAGDRLLVVRLPSWWPLRQGDLVAATDPRERERLLVKRVTSAGPEGVELLGDNPPASTDSRAFGSVARRSVWGVARYRYAPAGRAGWLDRHGTLAARRERDRLARARGHRDSFPLAD